MRFTLPTFLWPPLGITTVTLAAVIALGSSAHGSVLQPNLLDDEAYAETFTAVVDLKDGTYILAQLLFSNAGLGDGKAGCRVLVVPGNGKGSNAAGRFDRDEWSFSGGVLKVGPCSLFSRGGRTRFVAQADKLKVELDLGKTARRIRPPGYRVKVKDAFYEGELLVPWAPVKAKVKAPGARDGSGHGYLDHTRSTALVPDLAKRWIRFRGLEGDRATLIQIRKPPRGGDRGWFWRKGEPKPSRLKGDQIEVNKSGGGYTLTIQTPEGPVTVTSSKTLFRYEPVKQYGVLGRLAKSWVGNPITITMRASLDDGKGEPVTGILEVGLTRR